MSSSSYFRFGQHQLDYYRLSVEQILDGEKAPGEIHEIVSRIVAVARKYGSSNREQIEDNAQEMLCKLAELKKAGVTSKGNVSFIVCQLAWHLQNKLRGETRDQNRKVGWALSDTLEIGTILLDLNEQQKKVIALRIEGYNQRQIAKKLGVSPQWIASIKKQIYAQVVPA